MAVHRLQQLSLPMAMIGAGLLTLPGLTGNAKCVDVAVSEKLDRSFFRVRMERLTQAERTMLAALAEMEGPEYRLQDVADRMKMNVRALSPRRSSLIAKGMIYSPHTGTVSFTVPLFAEYLKRTLQTPS